MQEFASTRREPPSHEPASRPLTRAAVTNVAQRGGVAAETADALGQLLRRAVEKRVTAAAQYPAAIRGPLLQRGNNPPRATDRRTSYTLVLSDSEQLALTRVKGYFRFDAMPTSYLFDRASMSIDETSGIIRLKDTDFADQIRQYFGGGLTLFRGIGRHHPLWYEVTRLHLLMPLGIGDMPNFATNLTSYIPFGPGEELAVKVASGVEGMGPGDAREMIFDYASLVQEDNSDPVVGCVIAATVSAASGHSVGFFNYTENQIRGPLTSFRLRLVRHSESGGPAPDAPDAETVDAYIRQHGELRHDSIENALRAHGDTSLTNDDHSQRRHAHNLADLRVRLIEETGLWIAGLAMHNEADGSLATKLDSAVNRVAHAEYLTCIIRGDEPRRAVDSALAAASRWLYDHGAAWVGAKRTPEPETAVK